MKIKYLILITIITLFLISCSEDNNKGNISGRVILEGQRDYSDIYVAAYTLAELNSDIKGINEEYPGIGVQINQKTQFDHRLQSPIKYTQTDANGNYKLKDLPTDTYNIVAYKDSFGFKYVYSYHVSGGDNSLQDITLYPETYINSSIDDDITFMTDHHYIIQDNIYQINGYNLTIEPGAVIRIKAGESLKIMGDLRMQGNSEEWIRITTNYGYNNFPSSLSEDSLDYYNKFSLEQTCNVEDNQINWILANFGFTTLQSSVNNLSINKCVTRFSNNGIFCNNNSSSFVSNCLSYNIKSDEGGIYFHGVEDGEIKENILYECTHGIKTQERFDGELYNNYIMNNDYGVRVLGFAGNLRNNEMVGNYIDIFFAGNSDNNETGILNIYKNNLHSNKAVLQFPVSGFSEGPVITMNYNNLYGNDIFFRYRSSQMIGYDDIDLKHNYFNGIDNETGIREKIYDMAGDYYVDVDISNFQLNDINSAGIDID